ncbi:MAG TPA: glycogen-binding domain-containing protein [Longimicrobiales bacterium]|nr:glycogen-binding domain-containing protein [Longimicrobiales bacterium]
MNDRVHRALDGELAREDLTAEERSQAARVDAAAETLRASIDRRAPADMDVAVMKRIRALGLEPHPAERRPALARLAAAAWAPRDLRLRFRPVYGLAAAAVLALIMLWPGGAPDPAVAPLVAEAPSPTPIYVQFRLEANAASNVALAGSFTDWEAAHALQQTAPGVWTTVLSVQPGVHDYVFVVDGVRMVPDPYAPTVADGFGGVNSRLTVLAPSRDL